MLATMAPPKKAGTRLLSSEEFLDWLSPGVFADLIQGEIAMHSPVSLNHARLVNFIDHLLRSYLEHEDLGELHRESVAVRLSARETFMPDLGYFTKSQAARLAPTLAPFAPTFILEALSPKTAENDRGRKFAVYELHGVQEYWILDPEKWEHRFYRRAGDMLEEFGEGVERIESASIRGFWVRRAWLSPTKLPRVSDCLKQILAERKAASRRRS